MIRHFDAIAGKKYYSNAIPKTLSLVCTFQHSLIESHRECQNVADRIPSSDGTLMIQKGFTDFTKAGYFTNNSVDKNSNLRIGLQYQFSNQKKKLK